MQKYILLPLLLISGISFSQPVCTNTSVGYPPINDLGTGIWNTFQGGLYPGGSNFIPLAHKNAGMTLASQVVPLDAAGNPDPTNGKIVFLSIGMSNCTQEFSSFIPMGNADPNKSSKVILVDGAQGGQTAQIIYDPNVAFWTTIATRLQNAGVTANQVQVIWYKEANQAGSLPTAQTYADSLLAQSKRVMNVIKSKYPNSKLCYVASRIYGGYASSTLNPEPYAYWTGWAKKWLIEAQINGDAKLQYAGATPNSPWLCWGTYNWADGTTPRNDGLTWVCPTDYQNDGTHPSTTGAAKVATKLLNFLDTDSTACWYRGTTCSTPSGISEQDAGAIEVFPNPATDQFTVNLRGTSQPANVTLEDPLGKVVYSHILPASSGNSFSVDCTGFSPGFYLLKVQSGAVLRTGKMQVVR